MNQPLQLISEDLRLEVKGDELILSLAAQGIQGPAGTSGAGGSQNAPPYAIASPLSALRVLALNSNNQLVLADSGTPDHAFRLVGLLQQAISSGTATPLIRGVVSDSNWAWELTKPIWLGTQGQLTQTAPTVGFLAQVATPLNSTQILFEMQEVTLL